MAGPALTTTSPPAPGSPAADGRPVLTARAIRVAFGGLEVLAGIDLDVQPGEILGIIGPNGAGKTTLFDCLSGLLPCGGQVWVGGTDVSGLPPHRRAAAGLGRSFQDARLFQSLTVLDALRVAYELHSSRAGILRSLAAAGSARRDERAAHEAATEAIAGFGLEAYRDKLVRELSTGTRRIVDLAAVMLQRPSVVLLDEPSSGIAQREAEALGPLLGRIRDDLGCAMVLVEHDMPLLLSVADRVVALDRGRVVVSGTGAEVVRHPEVVRSYLGGDPAAIGRSGALAGPAARRARPAAGPRTPRRAPRRAQPERG